MGQVVRLGQLSPPMSSHPLIRAATERTGGIVGPGVHRPDRHPSPSMLDRQSKIAVVGDHHSRLDLLLVHIRQQMSGHVDVRTQAVEILVGANLGGVDDGIGQAGAAATAVTRAAAGAISQEASVRDMGSPREATGVVNRTVALPKLAFNVPGAVFSESSSLAHLNRLVDYSRPLPP